MMPRSDSANEDASNSTKKGSLPVIFTAVGLAVLLIVCFAGIMLVQGYREYRARQHAADNLAQIELALQSYMDANNLPTAQLPDNENEDNPANSSGEE
mgnify:CR=1 FL=1